MPPSAWLCTVCGYVHRGPEPPETCPVCGAGRDAFEPAPEPAPGTGSPPPSHIVVIGAGAAGIAAVEAVREAARSSGIVLLSEEPDLPYHRLNLTRYLAGEVRREDLFPHHESWYEENGIALRRGAEAVRLDLTDRMVELRWGEPIPFDKLILAPGSKPFVPPIPGSDREGVFVLRTLSDADRILEVARPGARVVCVGGGLLGLETAGALVRRGVEATVIENRGTLMPAQLDPRAGERLAEHVRSLGIHLRLGAGVKELAGAERVASVVLEGGISLPADAVVIATGVRPGVSLARNAGLEVKRGIVVDDRLLTSHPAVHAAGDAAEHSGVLYGSWFVAQAQGALAGRNAAGLDAPFGGVPRSHALKILGLDTVSIGEFLPAGESYRTVAEEREGVYRSFVFREGRLVGANLVGEASLAQAARRAIESRRDFTALLSKNLSASDFAAALAQESS